MRPCAGRLRVSDRGTRRAARFYVAFVPRLLASIRLNRGASARGWCVSRPEDLRLGAGSSSGHAAGGPRRVRDETALLMQILRISLCVRVKSWCIYQCVPACMRAQVRSVSSMRSSRTLISSVMPETISWQLVMAYCGHHSFPDEHAMGQAFLHYSTCFCLFAPRFIPP